VIYSENIFLTLFTGPATPATENNHLAALAAYQSAAAAQYQMVCVPNSIGGYSQVPMAAAQPQAGISQISTNPCAPQKEGKNILLFLFIFLRKKRPRE
jgi:hypothetical protein